MTHASPRPWFLAVALVLGSPLACLAATPATAPEIRLTGIVSTGAGLHLAVVEIVGVGSRVSRVGDPIPGVGEISEIGPDSMRVTSRDGEVLEVRLSTGSSRASAPPPAPPVAPPMAADQPRRALTVDPDLATILRELAADPRATIQDLALAVRAAIGAPNTSEVTVMSAQFEPLASPAAAVKTLGEGMVLRVRVQPTEGDEYMVYLRPPEAVTEATQP